jgi:hypothetical protein
MHDGSLGFLTSHWHFLIPVLGNCHLCVREMQPVLPEDFYPGHFSLDSREGASWPEPKCPAQASGKPANRAHPVLLRVTWLPPQPQGMDDLRCHFRQPRPPSRWDAADVSDITLPPRAPPSSGYRRPGTSDGGVAYGERETRRSARGWWCPAGGAGRLVMPPVQAGRYAACLPRNWPVPCSLHAGGTSHLLHRAPVGRDHQDRLKRIQYRPALIDGFLVQTGLSRCG